MKEEILLEAYILSRQDTNEGHQKALRYLSELQKRRIELEKKLDEKS